MVDRLQIACDFETGKNNEENKTWVYMAGTEVIGFDNKLNMADSNDPQKLVRVDFSLESWYNNLVDIVFKFNKSADVWFHNIQFDGDFILYYFKTHNIECRTTQQTGLLQIQVTVYRGSRKKTITFKDTYALFHRQLETIGKAVGFNKKFQEYKSYPENCDNIPQQEIDYLIQDVHILQYMVTFINMHGVDGSTAASFGLKEIKRSFQTNSIGNEYDENQKLLDRFLSTSSSDREILDNFREQYKLYRDLTVQQNRQQLGVKNRYGQYMDDDSGGAVYEKRFPDIDRFTDSLLRKAYKGGLCVLNSKYKGKDLVSRTEDIGPKTREYFKQLGYSDSQIDNAVTVSLDVNSLYLKILRDYELPYGYFEVFDDEIPQTLDCGFVHVLWKGKQNWDYGPIQEDIPFDDSLKKAQECDWLDMWLTYPEFYILVMDQYLPILSPKGLDWLVVFDGCYTTYGYKVVGGYKFKQCKGFFNKFVDKWYKIKHSADKLAQILAKSVLVNAIGCIGKKLDVKDKVPTLVNNRIKYEPNTKHMAYNGYVALPAYVNSIGRCIMTYAIRMMGDKFIYSDTDSLKAFLGGELPFFEEGLPVFMQQDLIGGFKVERLCSKARFLKLKTYMEVTVDNVSKVTAAGIPQADNKFSWDGLDGKQKFEIGAEYKQLCPRHVEGGLVLTEKTRYIKAQQNYFQAQTNE